MEPITALFEALAISVAALGLLLVAWQIRQAAQIEAAESIRRKRESTLNLFDGNVDAIREANAYLKNEFKIDNTLSEALDQDTLNSIAANDTARAYMVRGLSALERFGVGVTYGVFDPDLIADHSATVLISFFSRFRPYIDTRRAISSETLWRNAESLVEHLVAFREKQLKTLSSTAHSKAAAN